MNKPGNIISATEDKKDITVIDILSDEDRLFKPFQSVDWIKIQKDLCYLQIDGELAHKLISPKKDVIKNIMLKLTEN